MTEREGLFADAAFNNDLDTLFLMLEQGSIGSPILQVAMVFASREGHIKALELLVQHGANVDLEPVGTDYEDSTPLTKAADFGQVASIKFLIENGANVNYAPKSTGNTPLKIAIDYEADSASQIEEIPEMLCSALLFEAGADPNIRDNNGKSALDIAMIYKYQEAIQRFTANTKQ
jgi:ankyrin repeat protein